MSKSFADVSIEGNFHHNVTKGEEQKRHEHAVELRNDLDTEERHEDPHNGDTQEQRNTRKVGCPAEVIKNSISQLHCTHRQHTDKQVNPNQRTNR